MEAVNNVRIEVAAHTSRHRGAGNVRRKSPVDRSDHHLFSANKF